MMNYYIMVVDDDPNIRLGLTRELEKEFGQAAQILSCENGAIAFNLIQYNAVDILITDIKMPVMNGIELLRLIREHSISCKSIVLSGFDDFNLVRDAMKYGAVDYLLKPVDFGLLNEAVCKLLSESAVSKEEFSDEASVINRQQVLEHYIRGKAEKPAEVLVFEEKYNLTSESMCTAGCAKLRPLRPGQIYELQNQLKNRLYDLLHRLRRSDAVVLTGDSHSLWIFLVISPDGRPLSNADTASIKEGLDDENCSLQISGGPRTLSDASLAIHECIEGFESAFYDLPYRNIPAGVVQSDALSDSDLPSDTLLDGPKTSGTLRTGSKPADALQTGSKPASALLTGSKLADALQTSLKPASTLQTGSKPADALLAGPSWPGKKGDTPTLADSLLARSVSAVIQYQTAEALKHLTSLFSLLNHQKPPVSEVKRLFTNFIYSIINENSKFIEPVSRSKFTEYDIFRQIETAESLSQLQKNLFSSLNYLIEEIMRSSVGNEDYILQAAVEYIKRNYNDSITLNDTAAHVYLNKNYFSTLFKNKMGTTFREYLRDYRIKEAVKLIRNSDMKIYEIAQAVGYNDSAHFIRAFKEVTGKSPSAYKER